MDLLPSARFYYVQVTSPAQCPEVALHLAEPLIYEVALCLGYVATVEELAAYISKGEIDFWQIIPHGAQAPVGLAIDSHPFGDHELYVHGNKGWDDALAEEALGAMAGAIFAADAAASWVYTAVALPVAPSTMYMLETAGFEVIRSDTDRGLKKTFGIERVVWDAYHPDA